MKSKYHSENCQTQVKYSTHGSYMRVYNSYWCLSMLIPDTINIDSNTVVLIQLLVAVIVNKLFATTKWLL